MSKSMPHGDFPLAQTIRQISRQLATRVVARALPLVLGVTTPAEAVTFSSVATLTGVYRSFSACGEQ
ncbi:hypothetical protein CCP3SC1_260017 [Gammaproteobacteria bacterium]